MQLPSWVPPQHFPSNRPLPPMVGSLSSPAFHQTRGRPLPGIAQETANLAFLPSAISSKRGTVGHLPSTFAVQVPQCARPDRTLSPACGQRFSANASSLRANHESNLKEVKYPLGRHGTMRSLSPVLPRKLTPTPPPRITPQRMFPKYVVTPPSSPPLPNRAINEVPNNHTFRQQRPPTPQTSRPMFQVGSLSRQSTPISRGTNSQRPPPSPHRPSFSSSAPKRRAFCIAVVVPGAGTTCNRRIYEELCRDHKFRVEMVGRSGANYDKYPSQWPENGHAPPNLETFGVEIAKDVMRRTDALVVGSRGGQVVLPFLWRQHGAYCPPAIVLNGGCAMRLPQEVFWPLKAITFLVIGGQDYFRGDMSASEYLTDVKTRVPPGNSTTAILFVNELSHQMSSSVLCNVMGLMLMAILSWKVAKLPAAELRAIVDALRRLRLYSGRLLYTTSPDAWVEEEFGKVSSNNQGAAHRAHSCFSRMGSPPPRPRPCRARTLDLDEMKKYA